VQSSPGHYYCQPQGKALDTAYSVVKVRFMFSASLSNKKNDCKISRTSLFLTPSGGWNKETEKEKASQFGRLKLLRLKVTATGSQGWILPYDGLV
jgi:hypothetical protein